jgi:hypothetical protein
MTVTHFTLNKLYGQATLAHTTAPNDHQVAHFVLSHFSPLLLSQSKLIPEKTCSGNHSENPVRDCLKIFKGCLSLGKATKKT